MSNTPNYWINLFTGTTWQEQQEFDSRVAGFSEHKWTTVQKIKPGDFLLDYITGISRFVGVQRVTSAPFQDDTVIYSQGVFPCRVKVEPVLQLTPETAVPIQSLKGKLSIFENLPNPHAWAMRVRSSPTKWTVPDGEAVVATLEEAHENPTVRKVDKAKLARRPRGIEAAVGLVTVPEPDDEEETSVNTDQASVATTTVHTEIQYHLLRLGRDLGFDVWVARNDRSRPYNGKALSEHFNFGEKLPLQFDSVTMGTIELIDALWLQGNAIVAAFEVESTTSIYSGLLRMGDLFTMQPNLNIPIYIVAPDERRDKVLKQVNRPTFASLKPPLVEICQFIAFETLQVRLKEAAAFIQYLKPDFLDELAESCALEES